MIVLSSANLRVVLDSSAQEVMLYFAPDSGQWEQTAFCSIPLHLAEDYYYCMWSSRANISKCLYCVNAFLNAFYCVYYW